MINVFNEKHMKFLENITEGKKFIGLENATSVGWNVHYIVLIQQVESLATIDSDGILKTLNAILFYISHQITTSPSY